MKNKNYNTDPNQRYFQGSSRFSHTTPHFLRFSRPLFGFQGFPRFLKVFQGNGHPVNVKNLSNNKKFWKKIKSLFSDKGLASSNIVLKEKGDLITDNQKLVNLFNTYFINNTDTL